jgi:hypothetical protein
MKSRDKQNERGFRLLHEWSLLSHKLIDMKEMEGSPEFHQIYSDLMIITEKINLLPRKRKDDLIKEDKSAKQPIFEAEMILLHNHIVNILGFEIGEKVIIFIDSLIKDSKENIIDEIEIKDH